MCVLAVTAAGCNKNNAPATPSPTKPTFTATLLPANEVPPVAGAESSGNGNATITFDVTRDAQGNITAGTATFVVNLAGYPAGTPINIAHIHVGGSGVNGSVVFSTTLSPSDAVVLTNGSGSFAKGSVAPGDLSYFQKILDNPAGYYFNVHSTQNPAGVSRGQLVRVQ